MNINVFWFFAGTRTVAYYDVVYDAEPFYSVEDYKREYAANNGAEELEGFDIEFDEKAG